MRVTQTKLADYAQRIVSGSLFALTIYGSFNLVMLFQSRQQRLREIEADMRARGELPGTEKR